MSLTSRVIIPYLGPEPEAEDFYATHLAHLFADYTPNAHGDSGGSVIYQSSLFGDIKLQIPKHPSLDYSKQLFAHSLWNAALIAAEAIESAGVSKEAAQARVDSKEDPWQQHVWTRQYWDMHDGDVFEIGAGTALPSIISYLSGARSVTSTDHPASTSVTTNIISTNIRCNIKSSKASPSNSNNHTGQDSLPPNTHAYGYLWGETTFYESPAIPASTPQDAEISLEPVPAIRQPNMHSFTKIIAADCLWIPSKHSAICKTILDYLVEAPGTEPTGSAGHIDQQPCALVIAGFHTGRMIVSDFFAVATGSHEHTNSRLHYDLAPISDDDPLMAEVKGRLKIAEIFEVDIDGRTREWMAHRPGESRDDMKRWCVCAALVRR